MKPPILSTPLRDADAYKPPARVGRIDLKLDNNEGPAPDALVTAALASLSPETLRRYPEAGRLEEILAAQVGLSPERVLVTAGGDDAIARACRMTLEPGRTLLIHTPTFEMIPRSAKLTGADVRAVPWTDGAFPRETFIAAIDANVGLVALVSPNNPTGGVVDAETLKAVSDAAGAVGATVLVDLAYTEFADEDLTQAALALPNAIIVRTFSKALGLAGLRVGWLAGPDRLVAAARAAGGPYPVSSVSLALAETLATSDAGARDAYVEVVRAERAALADVLTEIGARPLPSQANFVSARFDDAGAAHAALLERGISVRRFTGKPELDDVLRITCPGDRMAFARLVGALKDKEDAALPAPIAAEPGTLRRRTKETDVVIRVAPYGSGRSTVETGLGFFDHMLATLAKHGRLDLALDAAGDLFVDDHHTVEDCALALGTALDDAMGERRGIARFGSAFAPLDEALARAVVDLSGRPHATINLDLKRERIGAVATENLIHFFHSFAQTFRCAIHLDVLRGENDHHKAEAAFKAFAIALRTALARDGGADVPSTKGVL